MTIENPRIILATTSPHRIETFGFLGVPFTAEASEVDERFEKRPDDAKDLVLELAYRKAKAVAEKHLGEPCYVFGFDSVGWYPWDGGHILEKPQDKDEARERLKMLSNDTHDFYTGISVMKTNITDYVAREMNARCVRSQVQFRELCGEEIDLYLKEDPRFKTYALGYDPVGFRSAGFIESIKGSPTNIMRGIPLDVVVEILRELGLYPQKRRPKIVICASSSFREQMVRYKQMLSELGFEGIVHPFYEQVVRGERPGFLEKIKTEHGAVKRQYGFIKWYFDAIKNADGILVLNLEKNGIKGYVGVNTAAEMITAHCFGKKVFLLNPPSQECPSFDEVEATVDVVLNGDLSKIVF